MFDGRDMRVDLEVTFEEVVQKGGVLKRVQVERDSLCASCQGTRESTDSESLTCYSCKGSGVKLDAIFQKETRCNTCMGHGKLVQKACARCDGQGLTQQECKVEVPVERFSTDGQKIEFEQKGHETIFQRQGGKNGDLIVTLHIVDEADRWRSGEDVHSKHYIQMGEAIRGCSVNVATVHGLH